MGASPCRGHRDESAESIRTTCTTSNLGTATTIDITQDIPSALIIQLACSDAFACYDLVFPHGVFKNAFP